MVDQRERAAELRERGLSMLEIAAEIGVVHSTIVKWLNPEATKVWNRRDNTRRPDRFRGVCPRCKGDRVGMRRSSTEDRWVCGRCRRGEEA